VLRVTSRADFPDNREQRGSSNNDRERTGGLSWHSGPVIPLFSESSEASTGVRANSEAMSFDRRGLFRAEWRRVRRIGPDRSASTCRGQGGLPGSSVATHGGAKSTAQIWALAGQVPGRLSVACPSRATMAQNPESQGRRTHCRLLAKVRKVTQVAFKPDWTSR
jgi:hypothetical protein